MELIYCSVWEKGDGCQEWPDLKCCNQGSAPLLTPKPLWHKEHWGRVTRGRLPGIPAHQRSCHRYGQRLLLRWGQARVKELSVQSPWHTRCHILYVIIAVVGCDRQTLRTKRLSRQCSVLHNAAVPSFEFGNPQSVFKMENELINKVERKHFLFC